MRVCFVSPFPPHRSGIADYTRKLVDILRSRDDVEVHVVAQARDRSPVAFVSYVLSVTLSSWIRTYRAICAARPQIVHLQYDFSSYMLVSFPLFLLLLLLKRRHRIVLVATFHEVGRDIRIFGPLGSLFYNAISRLFDRIYVHTQGSLLCLVESCAVPRARVKVVPHGTFVFSSREDRTAELSGDLETRGKDILLFFGYIYPTKGLETLLRACALLARSGQLGRDFVLLVAGDVKERNGLFKLFEFRNRRYLRRMVALRDELGLSEQVKFIGFVEERNIYSVFRMSDIVVLPYTEVDQSGVLYTALAAQKPVVATRIGGLAETLRDAGVLVAPRNPIELASAIKSLFGDREYYNQVVEKYAEIASTETTEAVAEVLLRDYHDLFKRLRKRGAIIEVSAYFFPHVGGQEMVAKEIAVRLARRGYPVEVLTSSVGCPGPKEFCAPNLRTHYFRNICISHSPIMPGLLARLLRVPGDSILHVHTGQAFVPEVVYIVSRLRHMHYVAHVHLEVQASGRLGFLLPMYKRLMYGPFLRGASAVICLTQVGRVDLCQRYHLDLEKVFVVPNGVGDEFFADGIGDRSSEREVLFVGRLAAQKNVRMLVEAAAFMSGAFTLHIVGDGPEEAALRRLISERHLDNVRLPGRKDGLELIQMYRNASVFVLPSSHEGMPLVLLEAMASGVPVVASDIPEIRELVGDDALLVKEQTAEAYAQAIERVLRDDTLRKRLAEAGVKRAQAFRWERTIDSVVEVFREAGYAFS